MKTHARHSAQPCRRPALTLLITTLAALTGTARLTAQQAAPAEATPPAAAAALPAVDAAALAEEIAARRPAPKEMPAAVRHARVEAQIIAPGAAGGAPLTISRIAPPVLPAPPAAPRVVPAFTDAQRAAMRAEAPLKHLLFSPTITVYPGGVSLISWGHVDEAKDYQDYEAWVPHDLTSINTVGDFEVGRTRYSLMGFAHPATGRALEREAPTAAALAGGYHLTKGDAANAAALEPLRALLVIYKEEGAQLAATHAALQARQRAYAEWERQNPEPPRPAEIRYWALDDAAAAAAYEAARSHNPAAPTK
jgi:hypothetical protein